MLSTGLLWYQTTGEIEDRVKDAVLRYKEKYGTLPDACLASSKELKDPIMVEGIQVEPDDATLVNHLWVGVVA